MLESLLRGPDEVLLLDEPDNYLDVPGKIWLEERIRESDKTILMISHDRELLDNTATRVVTVELGSGGQHGVDPPGRLRVVPRGPPRPVRCASRSCAGAGTRSTPSSRQLVLRLKIKSEYNDGMASQYRAAQTRLRKFEEAGPPTEQPREQQVTMRLKGGRTGKRAVVCEDLELTGLMKPFDLEVWYGERVAVLGSNGSGKSHFLRLLAAGGSDPDVEHRPVGDVAIEPVPHTGKAKLGARVRPGWFVQTHEHPELIGRTLLEILHRGDGSPNGRAGMGREQAARVLDRYELAHAGEQTFESLSRRPAGAVPDPAARAVRRHPAAARRADRQPRRAVRRGARGGARGLRRHGARGDPRPLVRPRLRPLPRVRRRRRGLRVRRAGLGRGPGAARPMSDLEIVAARRVRQRRLRRLVRRLRRGRARGSATVRVAVAARGAAGRLMQERGQPPLDRWLRRPARRRVVGGRAGCGRRCWTTSSAPSSTSTSLPEHRRRGHGSAMLARARGRGPLDAGADPDRRGRRGRTTPGPTVQACPGPEFARARGYDLGPVDVKRELPLPVDDALLDGLAADAARTTRRTRCARGSGPVPDELLRGLGAAAPRAC